MPAEYQPIFKKILESIGGERRAMEDEYAVSITTYEQASNGLRNVTSDSEREKLTDILIQADAVITALMCNDSQRARHAYVRVVAAPAAAVDIDKLKLLALKARAFTI